MMFQLLSHSYKWTIPVKWNSLNSNNDSIIFDKGQAGNVFLLRLFTFEDSLPNMFLMEIYRLLCVYSELVIPGYSPTSDGLIKVNKDHMGFFRVHHNDIMWTTISEQLLADHLVLYYSNHFFIIN